MRASRRATAAAIVLAAEGVALFVVAGIELIGISSGGAASVTSAIALTILTLVGAAALIAFAIGTHVGRSWARSGGILFQVLAVMIAIASLTVSPIPWAFVVGAGLPGLLCFVLLVAAARGEAERAESAQ